VDLARRWRMFLLTSPRIEVNCPSAPIKFLNDFSRARAQDLDS
jgi:hypothetical protein